MAQKAEEVRKQVEKDLEGMQPDPDKPMDEQAAAPGAEAQTESEKWADFAQEFDSEEIEEVGIPATDEAAEAEKDVPPVDTPVEEPAKEPEVPEAEKPEPPAEPPAPEPEPKKEEEPATPQAETPPETPPAPQKTPQELETERQAEMDRRRAERDRALDVLAEGYKLSEEEAEKFVTNPEEVVPKFAARLFFDVFDAVTANLQGVLPQVVKNVQQVQTLQQQAENRFYEANPLLDRAKHKNLVDRYATAYVQVNPEAGAEDIIRDVGIQVMYAAGIDPSQGQAPAQATLQPKEEGVAPPPYRPAGAGAAHAAPAPKQQDNIWGAIADEMAEEYE